MKVSTINKLRKEIKDELTHTSIPDSVVETTTDKIMNLIARAEEDAL